MSRRPLTYANITATAALVIAIGGGTAWAAHHYLITSTSQIKPSVKRALRGHTGATGVTGVTGATGASGATGANLTTQTTLPSGQSESGVFAGNSAANATSIAVAIQYTQPLAAPILAGHIVETTGTTANCPGQGQAAPGYLCLYDVEDEFVTWGGPIGNYLSRSPSPDPGAWVFFDSTNTDAYVWGSWTVTAP